MAREVLARLRPPGLVHVARPAVEVAPPGEVLADACCLRGTRTVGHAVGVAEEPTGHLVFLAAAASPAESAPANSFCNACRSGWSRNCFRSGSSSASLQLRIAQLRQQIAASSGLASVSARRLRNRSEAATCSTSLVAAFQFVGGRRGRRTGRRNRCSPTPAPSTPRSIAARPRGNPARRTTTPRPATAPARPPPGPSSAAGPAATPDRPSASSTACTLGNRLFGIGGQAAVDDRRQHLVHAAPLADGPTGGGDCSIVCR